MKLETIRTLKMVVQTLQAVLGISPAGLDPLPDPNPCIEGMPICPTGIPCIFGRDQAQDLTCWQIPNAEKYCKSDGSGGLGFSNT